MGRRKRKTESVIVIREDATDLRLSGGESLPPLMGNAFLDAMARPDSGKVETSGRWEIEVDQDGNNVHGVRIYIPNHHIYSRAFTPFPVHLNTRQAQRLVMRWMNQMMDAHYTMASLERLYIQRNQHELAQKVRDELQGMERSYQEKWFELNQMKSEIRSSSGVSGKNGEAETIEYTGALDFVAALSTPEDKWLVRAVSAADQVVSLCDKAYLMAEYRQEDYLQTTEKAIRLVESTLHSHIFSMRNQIREWITESERLLGKNGS